MMDPALLVGAGGALGSLARFAVSRMRQVNSIPAGTLTVNVTGSLFISMLAFSSPPESISLFLCTGVLGGYTTFSTFSFETFRMLEDKEYMHATLNIVLNVAGGLAAVYAGYLLVR
jgi:fluoride exporter